MLNISSDFTTRSISCYNKKNQLNSNIRIKFGNLEKDTFEKGSIAQIMENFDSENNSNKLDKILKSYSKKIEIMPLIMDRVMYSVKNYMNKKIDTKQFSEIFLDGSNSLAKRVALGKDGDEYSKNYAPELSFIKSVNALCDNYNQKTINKNELNTNLEELVNKYIGDKKVREKHFPY